MQIRLLLGRTLGNFFGRTIQKARKTDVCCGFLDQSRQLKSCFQKKLEKTQK